MPTYTCRQESDRNIGFYAWYAGSLDCLDGREVCAHALFTAGVLLGAHIKGL